MKSWNIREAVLMALKETGVSMMYTSIVLFFGFLMFAISNFEGRVFRRFGFHYLGCSDEHDLLLLPSLLEFELTTRSFSVIFLPVG